MHAEKRATGKKCNQKNISPLSLWPSATSSPARGPEPLVMDGGPFLYGKDTSVFSIKDGGVLIPMTKIIPHYQKKAGFIFWLIIDSMKKNAISFTLVVQQIFFYVISLTKSLKK